MSKSGGEEPRIGVFVCHCGTNIAGVVDVKEVAEYAKTLPNVVYATDYVYMCSDPGQELIKQAIKEHNLNRIVVAACSPRLHELTFRRTVSEAGLNPFLFEQANIREQNSWVHMDNPEEATRKAKDLVRMAVAKARLLEPLEPKEVPVEPAVLVIGGGIAGIQASLDLANKGIRVYLVEKEPSIGGNMIRLDKTFPTLDCSACILTPKMVDVSRHPNITLYAYSEVVEVDGYIGNFDVKILKKPRYVREDRCTGCGKCAEVCPVTVPNEFDLGLGPRKAIYIPFPQAVPAVYTIDMDHCIKCGLCVKACGELEAIDFDQKPEEVNVKVGTIIVATGFELFDARQKPEYGYGIYQNVITSLQFERLVNASGPTGGQIVRPSDGKPPKSVAILLCVGSRDQKALPYCSRICCMYSLKHAHQIKEKIPDAEVYILYMDIRSFGKGYEEFYNRVQHEGVKLIRGRASEIWEDPETKNLIVRAEDTFLGKPVELEVEMVILATGVIPNPATEPIRKALFITQSPDGFLLEAHPKLNPMSTTVDGIYLAGMCQGPKDIPDTVAQASAAASAASIPILQGKIVIEPIVANVDENLCGGCGICESVCPYGAVTVEEVGGKRKARVNEAKCKGCGSCGAACPSGAITVLHFKDDQILAQVDALLTG